MLVPRRIGSKAPREPALTLLREIRETGIASIKVDLNEWGPKYNHFQFQFHVSLASFNTADLWVRCWDDGDGVESAGATDYRCSEHRMYQPSTHYVEQNSSSYGRLFTSTGPTLNYTLTGYVVVSWAWKTGIPTQFMSCMAGRHASGGNQYALCHHHVMRWSSERTEAITIGTWQGTFTDLAVSVYGRR